MNCNVLQEQGQGYVPPPFSGKAPGEGNGAVALLCSCSAVCRGSPGLERICWLALLTLCPSLQPSVEALEPNVS